MPSKESMEVAEDIAYKSCLEFLDDARNLPAYLTDRFAQALDKAREEGALGALRLLLSTPNPNFTEEFTIQKHWDMVKRFINWIKDHPGEFHENTSGDFYEKTIAIEERVEASKVRKEALEEAAKVADGWNHDHQGLIAKAIRELKEEKDA